VIFIKPGLAYTLNKIKLAFDAQCKTVILTLFTF